MKNFEKMLKPGGILIIDHLNFDNYLESGMQFLSSPIYYERKGIKVLKSYMLFEDGRPCMWRRDNVVDLDGLSNDVAESLQKFDKMVFRTQSFPHQLADFKSLLRSAFGENASYQILGNFKPLEEVKEPSVYVHIVKKSLEN
ncbi:hypothetical protein SK128_010775 [Halocaridina rubra]|uniref:Uncharacterized protein n=1 Tax=Halocaridina rubra TaxID=373956 RepID=A0AAN9AH33_HALRR